MVPAPTGGWLGSEDEPEPGADLIARMFILILGSVLALAHVYVWKRLVKDTTRPGRGRTILTVAMSGAAALLATTLFGPRFTDVAESGWLAWPGYLWFAVLGYLLLALLILEPVRLALRGWVRRGTPDAPVVPDPPAAQLDRRVFLARTTAAAAGVASVGLVGYGAATALGPPQVLQVPVRLGRLDPAFNGFRIAVVSDIHLGPLLGRRHTERIVRMINETDAGSGGHRRRPGGRLRREAGSRRGTAAGLGVSGGCVLRHRQPRILHRGHRALAARAGAVRRAPAAQREHRDPARWRGLRSGRRQRRGRPIAWSTHRISTARWPGSIRRARRSCWPTNRS